MSRKELAWARMKELGHWFAFGFGVVIFAASLWIFVVLMWIAFGD